MTIFDAAKTVTALDVAERYAGVQTVRKGRRAWCSCPFHQDRTPSCSFDLEGKYAGRFICSSCHAQGSSIDFVKALFNESAYDAARRICADYGIEYERAGEEIRERAKKKEAVDHLTGEICEALAFAVCVTGGIIKESSDKLEADEDLTDEDRKALAEIIRDAETFREAIQTPKDAGTAWALVTAAKDQLESTYKYLKSVDEQTGKNYVSWYRRGGL